MNERVPLSYLLTQNRDEQPPVEPIVPFPAQSSDGKPWIVTAVLERTAICSNPGDRYERETVRHEHVMVDPNALQWRTVTAEYDGARLLHDSTPGEGQPHRHRRAGKTPSWWRGPREADQEARAKSDERALKDQAEKAGLHFVDGKPDPKQRRAWLFEKDELAQARQRRCTKCLLVKQLEAFHANSSDCSDCRNAYIRDRYRQLHPDPPKHARVYQPRSRPEGCLRGCRPNRPDPFHVQGCPNRPARQEEKEAMADVKEVETRPPQVEHLTAAQRKEKLTKCFSCKVPKPASEFSRSTPS